LIPFVVPCSYVRYCVLWILSPDAGTVGICQGAPQECIWRQPTHPLTSAWKPSCKVPVILSRF
jgi:hypothetical protein